MNGIARTHLGWPVAPGGRVSQHLSRVVGELTPQDPWTLKKQEQQSRERLLGRDSAHVTCRTLGSQGPDMLTSPG